MKEYASILVFLSAFLTFYVIVKWYQEYLHLALGCCFATKRLAAYTKQSVEIQ